MKSWLTDVRIVTAVTRSTEERHHHRQLERGFPAALEVGCHVVKWLGPQEDIWELRLNPADNSRKPGSSSSEEQLQGSAFCSHDVSLEKNSKPDVSLQLLPGPWFRVEGLAKVCLDSWPVHVAFDNCVLLESLGLWQFVTQQWKLEEGNWMSHLAFLTSQFSCFLSLKKNSEMNISTQFSEITYLKEFYKLSTH